MLSRFVKENVFQLVANRRLLLIDTTDGASNMILLSKILEHKRITCLAHSLHLLLTVDSTDQEVAVKNVLQRCKEIVTTLHFKGHMFATERKDAAENELLEKLEKVLEKLETNSDNPHSTLLGLEEKD